jgi:hypothetical protein
MLIIVEKNEIDLSQNDVFLGNGLSGLSFCSCQKARCDLLDLPVLYIMLARIGYEHIKYGNTPGVVRNSRIVLNNQGVN